MAVHQIHEFFIHIDESELRNKDNVEKAKAFVENESYDFLVEGDLTIETFSSESEANQLEIEVLNILRA